MKMVCDSKICTGCKACVNVCGRDAIRIEDKFDCLEPVIDPAKCVECGLCVDVCPNNSPRELKESIYCKQGWAKDEIRCNSSSGGVAAELMRSFIMSGGYVASCIYKDGGFSFVVTNDLSEVKKFAGSKYVKSDPGLIYNEIRALININCKVLFIGLPCQAAAVLNVCGDDENLYTADLICHGTPSMELLRMYLAENGVDLNNAQDVRFRKDNNFGLIVDGKRLMTGRIPDHYTFAYLKALDYTENCYDCRYAGTRRVSDITLGDAWGQLSDTDEKGVSLILCQSDKGRELLEHSELELFDADLEKAKAANPQLNHPAVKPDKRNLFLSRIKEGRSVISATKKTIPMFCLKSKIKILFAGR